jgi:Trypsin-like peptidase domain
MANYYDRRLQDNNIKKDLFMNWMDEKISKGESDIKSYLENQILKPHSIEKIQTGNVLNHLTKTVSDVEVLKKYRAKIKEAQDKDTPDIDDEGFEAIVVAFNRPALLVIDGKVEDPDSPIWGQISTNKDKINKIIGSVGRIEIEGHPTATNIGTAFLVAENILITNRHVALEFGNQQLQFKPGLKAYVDYKEYFYPTDQEEEYDIKEILYIDQTYDLAVLKTSNRNKSSIPLSLKGNAPSNIESMDVFTCGYPAHPRRVEQKIANTIFGGIYGAKRVLPGKCLGFDTFNGLQIIGHDCSTLMGNSGSPVID